MAELNLTSVEADPFAAHYPNALFTIGDAETLEHFRRAFPELPIETDAEGKPGYRAGLLRDEKNRRMREDVERKFAEGDAIGIVISVGPGALAFVADNFPALQRRGIYEATLLDAYISNDCNNHGFSLNLLEDLFRMADKEKLRACGDELPEGEWFTIYRGVAGPRHTRRVRAFSWTLDLEKARWFAARLYLADPAVYMARVRRGEVLAYYDQRQEKEVICRPRSCKLLENVSPKRAN